jgi:hypothetical protein
LRRQFKGRRQAKTGRRPARAGGKIFSEKYKRFTITKARQLQGKPLRELEKRRQGNNNEKTSETTMETGGNPGGCRRIASSHRHPTQTIARRREAPGAHVQD